MKCIRRWAGRREWDRWWGRVGSQRWIIPSINDRNKYNSQYRLRQLLAPVCTTHILINATLYLCRSCSAPSWFDRVIKKPAVKANLAIYTNLLGDLRQCKSVALKLTYKLDINSCAIWIKSSHIYHISFIMFYKLKYMSTFINRISIKISPVSCIIHDECIPAYECTLYSQSTY